MKNKSFMLALSLALVLSACGANDSQSTAESTSTTNSEVTTDDTATNADGVEISNSLFTITVPAEFKDIMDSEVKDNQITIYHKKYKKDGFGGMAFTVWARELPSDMAGGPYEKRGELTDANGNKYEVVIGYPTELQWNYEESEEMPEEFAKLSAAAEDVVESLTGVNGATFEYGAGTTGEELYGDIIKKYKTAVEEGWDASKYEENDMSPEFYALAQDDIANIGFAYTDTDKDGIDELYVGTLKDDELKGSIYDIYTMVDGVPTHIVSGTARDRYYVYMNSFIVNEYSGGAMEYGKIVYALEPNSNEMVYQWATKYDAYENEEQPWFISYTEGEWENVTEDECQSREAPSEDYTALEYKALSEF
ncbi:MAG: hypothetical protein IJ675_05775 [Pseudobutyrivibrio sp.]|nr:hypothetical protein [Pseudobutyrivibrio sp.]